MNAWNVHYKEKPINAFSGNTGVFPDRKRISKLCGNMHSIVMLTFKVILCTNNFNIQKL